jgi:hypothetical protein
MNDWDEEISGVFIAEGEKWILLHDNQNDFLLDGLRFVHKSNIDEIIHDDDELFKESVFKLKYPELSMDTSFDLNHTAKILQEIKRRDLLFHFDAEDEEEIVVGKIESVSMNSFEVKTLDSFGKWSDNCTCTFDELSSLAIQNDYLYSLGLLDN